MFESLSSVLMFFITMSAFTFIGFPITFFLFKDSSDRGYAFAKLVSLLITGYIVWIGASLKIFHFSSTNSLMFFLWFAIISALFALTNWLEIKRFIKDNWKILLFEELLFWGFFLFFLLIRFGNPDLWHPYKGGEKPMDFAFLNGILRSQTFPPLDPWFSQATINYYYYGQYLMAFLIKITGINPAIFYNIALPYLFAQSALGAFSIIFNTTKSRFFGFFGSIFLVLIGNLAQIQVIIKATSSQLFYISEWYWNATRVMPNNEINEFPFFTFLYADLHGHMISLPIVVFLIAVLFSFFQHKHFSTTRYLTKISFLAFLLGTIYATNTWDYPGFTLLSILLIGLTLALQEKSKLILILKIIFTPIFLFFLSNLLFLPFILNYQKGPLGLSLYTGPQTRITDYLLIHGFFLFIFFSYILFHFKAFLFKTKKSILLLIVSILTTVILFFFHQIFFAFIVGLLSLAFLSLFSLKHDKLKREEMIFVLLFIFAAAITLLPDVFDLTLGLGRMNTVFKFYFQAWILYAISSAGLLFFIFKKIQMTSRLPRYSWIGIFVLFFLSAFSFIPTATYAKITDRMSATAPHTLDGKEYMKTSLYFDQEKNLNLHYDYLATEWINENIQDAPIILEGNTPFYRWGSRVSVYTGLPTVIGWDWHEKAHRSYISQSFIDERVLDVKTMYDTPTPDIFLSLAKKYNVEYIYVGELERAYYTDEGLQKFDHLNGTLFTTVYKNPAVTLYKVLNN